MSEEKSLEKGFIKLYRSLQDNPFWTSEPFTRGQAWVDLLMLANHKHTFFYKREIKIEVPRGALARSIKELADRWKWSRTKVAKFLDDLEKESQIKHQKNNVTTLIYIENYCEYQDKKVATQSAGMQQESSSEAPAKQQEDTYKELNNVNNVKECKEDIGDKSPKKKRFVKPSVEDISAYCLERKNKINPQQFYDYYESIGWKVGKNPMKNWKASVRTWERKHEENGQRDTRSRGEKHNDILDRIARESIERETAGGALGGGDIQEVQGEIYPQVDFGD